MFGFHSAMCVYIERPDQCVCNVHNDTLLLPHISPYMHNIIYIMHESVINMVNYLI